MVEMCLSVSFFWGGHDKEPANIYLGVVILSSIGKAVSGVTRITASPFQDGVEKIFFSR